jgi:hypothetical protein
MRNEKSNLLAGLALLFLGGTALLRILANPRVAELHGSDVVTLTGCGACFGVGLVALLGRLKLRSE